MAGYLVRGADYAVSPVEGAGFSNVSRVLSFGLMMPFMLLGLLMSRSHRATCALACLFAAAYTVVHLMSWALIRYRLPVDAVMLVFAGLALDRLLGPRLHRLVRFQRSVPEVMRL